MVCRVTAVVTAYRRVPQTLTTLARLKACEPAPDEILVHVDAGGDACRGAVVEAFPEIGIISSSAPVGPGGARNKLIRMAKHEIVASFDDDSFPIDLDYFARLQALFAAYPDAVVITAEVFTRNEAVAPSNHKTFQTATFMGGACGYRKSAFLQLRGFVPLQVAYGMEEVDVALQLHALRHRVLKVSSLRVFHDTDHSGHACSRVVSGTIANAALLAYLRYPPSCWPRGLLQVLNAVLYALRKGRYRGVLVGLLMVPSHLYRYRKYRCTATSSTVCSYLALRRETKPC